MLRAARIIFVITACQAVTLATSAQEFRFDPTEFEKPAFQIGGFLEGKAEYFRYDRNAAFYRLNTAERDVGSDNGRATGGGEIRARYEQDRFSAFATIRGTGQWDVEQGGTREGRLLEGGIALQPDTRLSVNFGKNVLRWGKGYGWNPVGFVERTRDPTDPDLSREGFWMLTADYVRSFEGRLQTIGITPVILPVSRSMNQDFGARNNVNVGGKLYLLYEDTDIDFMFLAGGTRTARLGADFARNILSNLVVHGEVAFITDAERQILDPGGGTVSRRKDALSFLMGFRYLAESDTTYIIEYYRNGTGFRRSEMHDFYRFAHDAVDRFESSGDQFLLKEARTLSQDGYGRQTPARDYLYLRVNQREPLGIPYFGASVISIVNLGDHSLSLTPELQYTGFTNLEIRLRGVVNLGGRSTEFGEKQAGGRAELRVRAFF